MKPELITDDIKKILNDAFKSLKDEVSLELYTKKGVNDTFNEFAIELINALSGTSKKIKPAFYEIGGEESKKRGVERSPTILVSPDKYNIRFTGAPLGEEGRSIVMTIIMASTGGVILLPEFVKRLSNLKTKRDVWVFVSPTCPYCPQQVLDAVSAAIVKKDMVSVEVIEIYENRDLAERYGTVSVPQTFVDGVLAGHGLLSPDVFIGSLLAGSKAEFVSKEVSPAPAEAPEGAIKKDLLVIGGGPAGLAAAIYAERAGLKTVVIEKATMGGQVSVTPVVENYPGFSSITGKSLVDLLVQQAAQYAEIHQSEDVREIMKKGDLFFITTNKAVYSAKGVVLVTGASSKTLDAPGEARLFGRGISYCAECDGYFFKDGKKVIVVGGGNTAATYALYLNNIGAKVTLVHRKDSLRAEQRLQESLKQAGIPIMYNSEVVEIEGDKFVKSVKIADRGKDIVKVMAADGVFIAIGYAPNNSLAKSLGLKLDEEGYIKVDERQRTSMPGVYAAGDITGGVKQIVVAVSQGSIAAISAFEDIASPYWKPDAALTPKEAWYNQ